MWWHVSQTTWSFTKGSNDQKWFGKWSLQGLRSNNEQKLRTQACKTNLMGKTSFDAPLLQKKGLNHLAVAPPLLPLAIFIVATGLAVSVLDVASSVLPLFTTVELLHQHPSFHQGACCVLSNWLQRHLTFALTCLNLDAVFEHF